MPGEIDHIRKINGTKKWGHPDSAVAHCSKLLDYVDTLQAENERLRKENHELEESLAIHDNDEAVSAFLEFKVSEAREEVRKEAAREAASAMCKECRSGDRPVIDREHNDFAHRLGPHSNKKCAATPIWQHFGLKPDEPQA